MSPARNAATPIVRLGVIDRGPEVEEVFITPEELASLFPPARWRERQTAMSMRRRGAEREVACSGAKRGLSEPSGALMVSTLHAMRTADVG